MWKRFRSLVLALPFILILPARAKTLYPFWETTSPDGRYTVVAEELNSGQNSAADPDDRSYQNVLFEFQGGKPIRAVMTLPAGTYYRRKDFHPGHYSLEAFWSADSSWLLALYQLKWYTEAVDLVDIHKATAINLVKPLNAFCEHHAKGRRNYAKNYSGNGFNRSGFVDIDCWAIIPKQDEEYDLGLRVALNDTGHAISLREVPASVTDAYALSDRRLNQTYQELKAILPESDRQSLQSEERTWVDQLAATRDAQTRLVLLNSRLDELEKRLGAKLDALPEEVAFP